MLRRIDPDVMFKKYRAGEFVSLKIPNNKINVSLAFTNTSNRIGKDHNSRMFRFNDKTNVGQIVATTNHGAYQYGKDLNENKTPTNRILRCRWTGREIKDRVPIGIPISMEKNLQTGEIVFHVDDTYSNFGCALAGLKRFHFCHRIYRDPLYMNAEQLLHCMYYAMYPDKKGTRIVEAKDPRLLEINGGPLTDEEYDDENYEYVQMPNVAVLPLKRQFFKLTLPGRPVSVGSK